MTLPAPELCPGCGRPMVDGQCPRCLLVFGLDAGEAEPAARRFGDYEIEEEIARGGMGVVYRARQVSLKRPVAIKRILGGELASIEAVQRFHLEAEAAAALRHPNIVAIHDVGVCDNEHYIAMEYIEGGSLAGHREWDAKTAAAVMAKVARALAYAHEHGILHRDLKPSNILLDGAGEPRLTDFGLAKLTTQDRGLTLSQTTLGSPGYMAPEQAAKGEATTAADIYGLGAVLYDLLARRPPFVGATPMEVLRRAMDDAPDALPASVPRDLATICLKCLEKLPAARYASARELADDLERFVRGEVIAARPVSRVERLVRWARRRPLPAALLATTLLALIVGVSGVLWQWRKAEHASGEHMKALRHLRWQQIEHWLDEGDTAQAIAYLAAQIRERPGHWQAATYAMSIIDRQAFPVSAGPGIHPAVKLTKPACLSPGGDWIVAAGEDRTVRAWEVASGREVARLALESPVTALATGSAGAVLAIATEDGRLVTLSSLSATPVAVARNDTVPIEALAFSADGRRLMARSKERVEVNTAGAAGTALTLEGGVSQAALAANGERVLAWNAQRAVVWDAASGQEVLRVAANLKFQRGAISGDGRRITLVEDRFQARSWDAASGHECPPIERPGQEWQFVALNHEGTRVTLAGGSNDLFVHDVDSGLGVSAPMKHSYNLTGLVISADGQRTASYGLDDVVRVWDAGSGRALMSPLWMGRWLHSSAITLSADGRVVLVHRRATADAADSLAAWRTSAVRAVERHEVAGMSKFSGGRLSPDERLGCLGLQPANRCHVYELATGKVLLDQPTNGPVYVHLLSPDGLRCYALTGNGWLHGWSLQTGEALWEPQQQPGHIRPATVSPDGTRIVAGHDDGHIRGYDTATGRQVQVLDHRGEIKSLRFAPGSSDLFVSAGTDHQARTWSLKTGQSQRTFTGHTHTILSTAWSADGRRIATASYDATACVWDAASGRMIGKPMAHFAWLSHLEFSPDGRILATACRDGTVRLWNPETGEPLSDPIPQGPTCEAVRFTADGAALFVRDHSGFRFYDIENHEPLTQHFPGPVHTGCGMDGESYRAFMKNDGTGVLIAATMDAGEYWHIEQPRGPAPPWFADLLEALALLRLDAGGAKVLVPGQQLDEVRRQLQQSSNADGPHARWARRVLGLH